MIVIHRTMAPTGILQLTEKLPLELLEKVLAHTSVPDILRMKQVGRNSDRSRSLQLNLSDIVLVRLFAASTISSRIRPGSSTGSTSFLRG